MKLWKKILLITVAAVAVLVLAAGGIVLGKLSQMKQTAPVETVAPEDETFETNTPQPSADVTQLDPEDVVWPSYSVPELDKEVVNILLIGQDRREGEERQRSDTMIIVSYSKQYGTVKLISLMRDLYVQIPGYSDNRINAAYVFGGMELLDETIEVNFGIPIDGNFEVDFDGFAAVIDILGGVDITLTKEEARYIKDRWGYTLSEGLNHMNGSETLAYARIRYVGNDDYERTERQRAVLTQVMEDAMHLDTAKKLRLLDEILPYLATDMSKTDTVNTLLAIMQNGVNGMDNYRIPADGAYTSAKIRGMYVLVPDLDQTRVLLDTYINES